MANFTDTTGLPSPVASMDSPAPSNASTVGGRSGLPTARRHPLKPGSAKEIALINYVDDKVLRIARRYGMKFTEPTFNKNEVPGYTTVVQVIEDIEPLIDIAWASGTPAVQIPYLLSLAGIITSYMSAFPFSTRLFRILKKLDTAFSTLIRGTSGDAIRAHPVSTTEKVRIKSLVEETKLVAVHVASASGVSTRIDLEDSEDDADVDDMEVDGDDDIENGDDDDDDDDEKVALAISRIYKTTIDILGDSLVFSEPVSTTP